MTHQENYNLSSSTVEELTRNGLEAIPELVRVILNSVMQAERSHNICRLKRTSVPKIARGMPMVSSPKR